jgi:hypothetical protein
MQPVLMDIAMPSAGSNDDEIVVIDDVDQLSSTEVMLGCGDDNPY